MNRKKQLKCYASPQMEVHMLVATDVLMASILFDSDSDSSTEGFSDITGDYVWS